MRSISRRFTEAICSEISGLAAAADSSDPLVTGGAEAIPGDSGSSMSVGFSGLSKEPFESVSMLNPAWE